MVKREGTKQRKGENKQKVRKPIGDMSSEERTQEWKQGETREGHTSEREVKGGRQGGGRAANDH